MDALAIAWTLAPLFTGALLGWAGVVMSVTPPEFKTARFLAWLSFLPLVAVDLFWAATTDESVAVQVGVSAIVGAAVGIGLMEMLRRIDKRERVSSAQPK